MVIAMYAPCRDTRECFAVREFRGKRKCSILTDTYMKDGECPYCKKCQSETNGKNYEWSIWYKAREGMKRYENDEGKVDTHRRGLGNGLKQSGNSQ